MNYRSALLFILAFGFGAVSAQTPDDKPKPPTDYKGPVTTSSDKITQTGSRQISGGVMNGKARSLPKPQFPAAARAVGASGLVTVQVLIDETGAVVSATAISGHPLLRAASVQAARGALFSPTLLEGQPVKVVGVITYNYVLPMTVAKLGFVLSSAERSASFAPYTNLASLEREFHGSWTEEKELLKLITFEAAQQTEEPKVQPSTKKIEGDRYTTYAGPVFSAFSPTVEKIDQRSLETLRQLSDMIAERMAQDERSAWNFKLGKALGITAAEVTDDIKLAANLNVIESLLAETPASLNSQLAQAVRDFVAKGRQTVDDKTAVRKDFAVDAERLSNNKY